MCITAIVGSAILGAGASLAAGSMQSSAAKRAADTQAAAADKSLALQERIYEENVARQQPFLDAGLRAQEAYQGELGLSDAARNGTFESQFRETPGYAFQVAEGEKGVLNNLSALGMKNSGAALKSLTRFRQGLADTTYDNYLSRLNAAATGGQAVTRDVNALGQTYANNSSTLMQDSAAATASGYAGSANAWSNALANMSNIGGQALGLASNNFGYGYSPWGGGNFLKALSKGGWA